MEIYPTNTITGNNYVGFKTYTAEYDVLSYFIQKICSSRYRGVRWWQLLTRRTCYIAMATSARSEAIVSGQTEESVYG